MTSQTIAHLKSALAEYREAVAGISDPEDKADFQRLISIVEQIIDRLEAGDITSARNLTLAFSRCVTDSFATQPRAYQRLSNVVHEVR